MTYSIFKSDLTVEKTFSGNVLDSFGFECDSERSYYSDEAELPADSRCGNDWQEANSQVESQHLLQEQPYGNDLMLSYLQDVSRIFLLSPMGSIGFIVVDQSPLVQGQMTASLQN